jgi:hypothetical protein
MSPLKLGAPWWRESILPRRHSLNGFGLLGGAAALTLAGCYDELPVRDDAELAQRADEIDTSVDALDLQRARGWNVGQPDAPIFLPKATQTDALGGGDWRARMEDLAWHLTPSSPSLQPYYVPTLFQSLIGPTASALRMQLAPMRSPEMDEAYGRGRALRAMFGEVDWPTDTAIVVDLPGPESLAVAAALADRFEPVFTFGNWPHPLGVVPAHETLAATLFYLPLFDQARALRPAGAPPVFVLDGNRLAPYSDEDTQFDNRYLARLPTAEALKRLGIHHVLYVAPDQTQTVELDDLNTEFVALNEAGVDVKMLALDDFEESEEVPLADIVVDMTWIVSPAGLHYYYGGDVGTHLCFWRDYGWYHPKHAVTVGPPSATRMRTPIGHQYVPRFRVTMFAGGESRAMTRPIPIGGGVYRPASFGRVAVRTSRSDGTLTGVRAGRTGSFGRFHGGGSWGG